MSSNERGHRLRDVIQVSGTQHDRGLLSKSLKTVQRFLVNHKDVSSSPVDTQIDGDTEKTWTGGKALRYQ